MLAGVAVSAHSIATTRCAPPSRATTRTKASSRNGLVAKIRNVARARAKEHSIARSSEAIAEKSGGRRKNGYLRVPTKGDMSERCIGRRRRQRERTGFDSSSTQPKIDSSLFRESTAAPPCAASSYRLHFPRSRLPVVASATRNSPNNRARPSRMVASIPEQIQAGVRVPAVRRSIPAGRLVPAGRVVPAAKPVPAGLRQVVVRAAKRLPAVRVVLRPAVQEAKRLPAVRAAKRPPAARAVLQPRATLRSVRPRPAPLRRRLRAVTRTTPAAAAGRLLSTVTDPRIRPAFPKYRLLLFIHRQW